VFIRAGTYYMGGSGTLVLTEADSNASWAAYPADAPACVVLSGALPLWRDSPEELLAAICAWTGPAEDLLLPACVPPEAADFVRRLLHPAAEERLGGRGLREAQTHEWVRELDGCALHRMEPPQLVPAAAAPAAQQGAPLARQNSVLWRRTAGGTSLLSAAQVEQARQGSGSIAETEAEASAGWFAEDTQTSRPTPLSRPPTGRPPTGNAPLVRLDE
jgi:hypothetical protein